MRSPMLARSRGVVQTTASSGALSPASSMTSMLRGGCGFGLRVRRDLGRVRDLPHDLDDVPLPAEGGVFRPRAGGFAAGACSLEGVEDVQLPVGSVAAAQDLVDALQLFLR